MRERWDVGKKGQDIRNVKGRYFIDLSASYRRSLIVNTLKILSVSVDISGLKSAIICIIGCIGVFG